MAKPEFYANTRSGSNGPDVAMIQTWLNGIRTKYSAIPALVVDGKFGAKTNAAVKQFQAIMGLASDGIVGPKTWNALYDQHAVIVAPGEKYSGLAIRSGHKGATVKSAQTQLTAKGNATAADGIHGAKTTAAIKNFQRANGLVVDGIVGPKTWAKLYA